MTRRPTTLRRTWFVVVDVGRGLVIGRSLRASREWAEDEVAALAVLRPGWRYVVRETDGLTLFPPA